MQTRVNCKNIAILHRAKQKFTLVCLKGKSRFVKRVGNATKYHSTVKGCVGCHNNHFK